MQDQGSSINATITGIHQSIEDIRKDTLKMALKILSDDIRERLDQNRFRGSLKKLSLEELYVQLGLMKIKTSEELCIHHELEELMRAQKSLSA